MKYIVLFLVLCSSMVWSQETTPAAQKTESSQEETKVLKQDSIDTLAIEGYGSRTGYVDTGFSLRSVIGFQKSTYAAIGIARTSCSIGCVGFGFRTYYAEVSWNPIPGDDVYGVGLGGEFNAMGLVIGIDGKYQSNFKEHAVVFTPKVGIGICGVSLFYSYTISTKAYPFQELGRHGVSLVIHFRSFIKLF